jgi:hypothetical protein
MPIGLIFGALHPSLPTEYIIVLLVIDKFILLSSGFGVLPVRIKEIFSSS